MSQAPILAILPETEAEAICTSEIAAIIGTKSDCVSKALKALRKWHEVEWKHEGGSHGRFFYWRVGGAVIEKPVERKWRKEWSRAAGGKA
jgi:DNA-binding transcriptional regulator GbsR (MarR family)